MRLFQRDAYISIDFLEKKTEVIRLSESGGGQFDIPLDMPNGSKKVLQVEMPAVPDVNAIRTELAAFADAVTEDKPVAVTAFDGYQAMEVAHLILRKMSLHNQSHNE